MESSSMDQEDNSTQRKWYEGDRDNIRLLLEEKAEVIAGWREMRNLEYWENMRQQKELKENEKDEVVNKVTPPDSGNPTLKKTQAAVPSMDHGIKIFRSHVGELMVPLGMLGNQVRMLACQLGTLEEQLGGHHADVNNRIEGVSRELRAMEHQYKTLVEQSTILAREVADLEAAHSRSVNVGVGPQMMEVAPAEGSSEKASEDSTTSSNIGRGCGNADLEAASASNNEINGGKSSSFHHFTNSSSLDIANATCKLSELRPNVSRLLISEFSGNGASNNGVIQNDHTDARQKRTNVEEVSEKSILSRKVDGVIPVDQSVSVALSLEMENDLNTEHNASSRLISSLGKVSSKLAHGDEGMSVPENGDDDTGKGKYRAKRNILPSTNGKQGRGGTRKTKMSTETRRSSRNTQARIPPSPSEVKPFEFECDACKKRFSNKSSLHRHLKCRKAPKHECSYCSSKFHTRNDLIRHFITHTGLRPWTCGDCGNTYNRKDVLAEHLRCSHGKSHEDSKKIANDVTKKYLEEHASELKGGRRKQGRQSDAYLVYQFANDSFKK